MAITTYSLISRQTVGSAGGVASITFSNIPQTFTDLKIVASGRTDYNGLSDESYVKLNGSSASIYSWVLAYSSGTASAAATDSAEGYGIPGCQNNAATSTANVFCNGEIYIPNYASANYKRISLEYGIENNATATNFKAMTSGLWGSTAAVTSVSLSGQLGNYVQYSTFSLYGISSNTTTQNTSIPYATGGDIITTDGTYWYHQFLYSGTFTPTKALTADYLVVAGGGGGGGYAGGGGGAGGFRTSTGFSLTAQAYTCTIGAGGAGGNQSGPTPVAGSNSVFSSITSTGGGLGGDAVRGAPSIGGSGGGGGYGGGSYGTGAVGTSGQGSAGGNGTAGGQEGGGGGGGATGTGANGVSNVAGGAGGAGTASSYSGSSVTYAGGGGGGSEHSGGGGAGGAGGGGAGTSTGAGTAGTANRGGGGGGAGTTTGGNGGSGIVIVRYAV